MSTIVYRISLLLGAIVADVPVGTNLGLFWLLWALISGRFLLSRGAVFPALADGGLPLGSGPLWVKPPPLGLMARQSRTQAVLEQWSPAASDSPIAGPASRSNRSQGR